MNENQKRLLLIGIAIAVLMGLVPPWTTTLHYQSIHLERPAGYSFIFAPPKAELLDSVGIDFRRLLLQWTALALATGGGLIFFREPTKHRHGNVAIRDAARDPLCAFTSQDHEGSNRRNKAYMPVSDTLFSFQGRISRQTFWTVWATMMASALIVGLIINATLGEYSEAAAGLQLLWSIPVVWIMLAAQVKRWHDLNKSGWMILIGLIPILGILIALAFLGFVKGTSGSNNYGNDPLNAQIQGPQAPSGCS